MIGSSLKYIALLYFVFVGVLYFFLNMCISDLLQLVGTSRWTHPSNTLLLCILYFVFVVVGLYFFRLSVYY